MWDWKEQGRALMASALALWHGRLQSSTYQYSDDSNGSNDCTMPMLCLVMTNPHWIITQFCSFLSLERCSCSFIFFGRHLCFYLLTSSSSRQLFTLSERAVRKPRLLLAPDNVSIELVSIKEFLLVKEADIFYWHFGQQNRSKRWFSVGLDEVAIERDTGFLNSFLCPQMPQNQVMQPHMYS